MSVVVPVVPLAGRVELPAQPAVQVFLPPIYSSGWKPCVSPVRPDSSIPYPARQRKPLSHRLYETGRVRCIYRPKLPVAGCSRTDFVRLYRGHGLWHQAETHVSQTGCHRFWMGFLGVGQCRPAGRLLGYSSSAKIFLSVINFRLSFRNRIKSSQ